MIDKPKGYFRAEKVRNADSAVLFTDMLKHAFGEHNIVIIGHHLTFEDTRGTPLENVKSENEIPSADTLMFDHDVMQACFGSDAIMVMQSLASVRTDLRDALLAEHWKMYGPAAYRTPEPVMESTEGSPATDPALW